MNSRHPINPDGIPQTNAAEQWLDKQDVLIRMHISSRTLQQWRKEKIISYSKIKGKIYYRESDLLELLRKNMVIAKSKNGQ